MLQPLTEEYLDTILSWRNQEEVRQYSFTNHVISKNEHYIWWQKIKNDLSRKWYLFIDQGTPCAVINFYDIEEKNTAFWGFYLADFVKEYDKLKIWYGLEKQVIQYARENLKLKSLKCELLEFNKAALFMHKRSGYKKIGNYTHERGEVVVLQIDII